MLISRHYRMIFCLMITALIILVGCNKKSNEVGAETNSPTFAKLLQITQQQLTNYQKIIVLFANEDSQTEQEKNISFSVGQTLFHENIEQRDKLQKNITELLQSTEKNRFNELEKLLDYIESEPSLYDADRLAFTEILKNIQTLLNLDSSLPAIKLNKRIAEDLDSLNEIEHHYNKEITQIFSCFDRTRSIPIKREKWDDYILYLNKKYQRDIILRDYGVIVPYPMSMQPQDREITGINLPEKTIVLSFDDGPHAKYTDEITAILKRYDAPAIFFEIGKSLGNIDADGKANLSKLADISRHLSKDGYILANHSFSHISLAKETGEELKKQVLITDSLLKEIDKNRAPLFRFPYGARNAEGLQILNEAQLKSVMWNIDSLDWADPVPDSIVQRVWEQVDKQKKGIILFHDIHERTVKALPQILDKLSAEGYQFATWNGRDFTAVSPIQTPEKSSIITTGYNQSWAIIIGIDDYQKWPELEYAGNDADAMATLLTTNFGFRSSQVIVLKNQQATRNNILSAFHERLIHNGLQKDDRVFVFFAGHGATLPLASGRDLGYLIPVDSDPKQFSSDAIAMSDIQNIAESLPAKHVFFIMDACYSGLGLTRGGNFSSTYLRENAKRIGRQMLTAGGADQLVSDSGPNGHSIFTWVVLQGLEGKADLNGDSLITATELAAYVAPTVSAISPQTPAFGSLPGSQGGEFVFTLSEKNEYLTSETPQLSTEAIALNQRANAVDLNKNNIDKEIPIIIKNLQGSDQAIKVPLPKIKISDRQLAQRANEFGLQLYKEKRYADAELQFTEALKLNPNFALAANNLGFIYYRQGKYVEAIRWLENTIKMDKTRSLAYLNLGDSYYKNNQFDKAKTAYQTYLTLQPQGGSAVYVKQQLSKLN